MVTFDFHVRNFSYHVSIKWQEKLPPKREHKDGVQSEKDLR